MRYFNTFRDISTKMASMSDHLSYFTEVRGGLNRYANSKLLAAMFVRELSSYLSLQRQSNNHRRIIINSLCPGHVNTDIQANLPFYMRIPNAIIWYINGRTVHSAGRFLMHAMFIDGEETDTRYMEDGHIARSVKTTIAFSSRVFLRPPLFFRLPDIVYQHQGQMLQMLVWKEALSLLRQYKLPFSVGSKMRDTAE